ncbi:hypothetical protein BY996DRAFT_6408688 [Phakopsora pachyrhizi]|uniref:Pyruvate dehydrogenase X component n=1 Tax=Phakopsora pachyrhizi TaxID=170000 RepID=A0AAV0AKY3_PHAPC|nr:hypothetical protein BY996DRAFT_6408688 [Phakopsora pachyrhizi]CAH7667620.1 hypothetical protein PPACK8108_LOCUS2036 [Phakopsora pachyrhizi]
MAQMVLTIRKICYGNESLVRFNCRSTTFNRPFYIHRVNLHVSSIVRTISPLRMPALSPTMESGQISNWQFKPGEKFSAGDVLLTVETDKASMDVEAQDDGYMGPQMFDPVNDSKVTIPVGELIAILGEEECEVSGDVKVPEEWTGKTLSGGASRLQDSDGAKKSDEQRNETSSTFDPSKVTSKHSTLDLPRTNLPLSPAVSRILVEHGIDDATKIKGSGLHGRLTKGDVLKFLGKVSSPLGTAQKMLESDSEARLREKPKIGSESPPEKLISAAEVRRLIADGLHEITSRSSTSQRGKATNASFESVLRDYDSMLPKNATSGSRIPKDPRGSYSDHFLTQLSKKLI